MEDRRVRELSFTGSTEIGKFLMKQIADMMKNFSLELGGHAPFIVFADANIENAVASQRRNMGQTCVAANRIFVQEGIKDELTQRLIERMAQSKVGNGLEEDVLVGPLIEPKALEKVERHIADATEEGAAVALGGEQVNGGTNSEAKGGAFYAPTVLTGADDTMLVVREEAFGPVAALLAYKTEQEVIERVNDTIYGLAAYYFTRDIGRVMRLAERLEYGILGANDGMPSTAHAPFGGVKESGSDARAAATSLRNTSTPSMSLWAA